MATNNRGSYRLNAVFGGQRDLALSMGLRPWDEPRARRYETESEAEKLWRTCRHEAGHTVAALLRGAQEGRGGIAIVNVWAQWRGESRLHTDRQAPLPAGPVEDRIALDLGGPLAEETIYGDCDPSGAWQDLVVAKARAGGDLRTLAVVAGQVQYLLGSHRELLERLASRLFEVRHLDDDEVRALLGPSVPAARYTARAPDVERERMREAVAEMDRIKDEHRID